jgi:DNA invertase Pin-like site-specific DNA recombinase
MADEDDFVASIGEMISYFLDLRGLPESDCNALSQAVTEQIRNQYRGERVTIRKKPPNIRAQVRAAYNGSNANDLARQFGISRSSVHRYCRNLSQTRRK